MNEVDALKQLLEEQTIKNRLLTQELKAKNAEIDEILNNSAYETYRTVIESAKDIIFKTDAAGNFTYVNPEAENSVGYDKDELIGMHFSSIIRPDYLPAIIDAYALQLETKQKTSYTEFPVVKKDGTVFWVGQNVQPIIINEQIVGFNAIARDITEKINSQKKLQQNEEKYRSIIQNMNLGLLVVDNDELVLDVNPSFLDMLGYTREELIGRSAPAVLAAEEKKGMLSNVIDMRKEGKSSVYELLVKDKLGENRWMLVSGSPVYDTQNKVVGSIGIHLDVTERKRQMAELTEARLKAEDSVRSKEMFLANMSHEIRTPMNAIIGMSRLLSETEMPKEQNQYVDAIRVSSESLLVIINDILDFSKIDVGKMTLDEAIFPFHSMTANIMLQLGVKAQEKKLKFTKSVDPDLHDYFNSDRGRLTQILVNLIGNAIKFTEAGEVKLSCRLVENFPEKQLVRFSISDTGTGIDPDKLHTIFESFMQENSTISRKYGGTGLGLSISKELVKLFGGELTAESTKGKGSTFWFEVLLKKGSKVLTTATVQPKSDFSKLKGKSVLLVEDNQMNQKLALINLQRLGLSVTIADDGYKCLDLLQTNVFDVVLMDLQMPGIDGLGATFAIRNKLKNSTPVIALTANALASEKEKCFQAGMNDYITKPFDKNDLGIKLLNVVTLPGNYHGKKGAIRPVYDLAKIQKESGDNEAFVATMAELFCGIALETILQIDKLIANKKYDLIKDSAHKIKPSIDMLDIHDLKPIVREIERATVYDDRFWEQLSHFKSRLIAVQILLRCEAL